MDQNLNISTNLAFTAPISNSLLENLFLEGYQNDRLLYKILYKIRNNIRFSNEITLSECKEIDGKFYNRDRLYAPDFNTLKLQILKMYHDDPSAGHPGREKNFRTYQQGPLLAFHAQLYC